MAWACCDAVEPLEAVLASAPNHHATLWQLADTYPFVERYDDAETVLLRLIDLLDRERGRNRESWNAQSVIDGLVGQLRQVYLMRGELAAAAETPDRRLGQRYREPSAYSYSYNNNPFQRNYATLWWFTRHGMFADYVERFQYNKVFDRWSARSMYQLFEARHRAGDERALEDLWDDIVEPGRALVGVSSSGGTMYYTSRSPSALDPRASTLAGLFREQGRTDELAKDWTAVHELFHFSTPPMATSEAWFFEGLSTYLTALARSSSIERVSVAPALDPLPGARDGARPARA